MINTGRYFTRNYHG